MRIALFYNLPSGGAKRTVYEQVKRLVERHQVDLFSLSCANHDFADVRPYAGQVDIAPFQPLPLFKSPLGRLNQGVRIADILRLRRVMRSLADHIDQSGYDVALVHPCQLTFSPMILRYLRIPTLYYRHDVARSIQDPPIRRPYHRESNWRKKIDLVDPLRFAYFRLLAHEDHASMCAATRVVTNSYFVRESLYRVYGVAPFVCYHGVDTERFKPLKMERDSFVLSVGMLMPIKGYDFVIESLGHIPQARRPRLVIVSNMRLEEEACYLEELAQKRQVELELKTMVDDQQLVQLYNRAQCMVYAPVMESFGLAPLESMACGTPVVGICEGGVRETIVHSFTGLLADRDPEQFAKAILALLEDRQLAERLGDQARKYVLEKWNWERAIDNLETHLHKVASQDQGGN